MKASELRAEMRELKDALAEVSRAALTLIDRLNDVAIAQLASEHRINEIEDEIAKLKVG